MSRFGYILGIVVVLTARFAAADCTGIPIKPGVKLFEPTQRAAIAFNGEEEILLLSTDLRGRADQGPRSLAPARRTESLERRRGILLQGHRLDQQETRPQ